jgi:hypothetical protein
MQYALRMSVRKVGFSGMIIVVEGTSAAGKTTWCHEQGECSLVKESFPDDRHLQAPEGLSTARYWTDWNVKRWKEAILAERHGGLAICDTDPLKLHYCWGLWQVGVGSENQWLMQLDATRTAVLKKSLGFADLYLVKEINPDAARRQRDNDVSRKRDRFELHLRLQKPLIAWYSTLQVVLGERVVWGFPEELPVNDPATTIDRYSLETFDDFIALLPDKQ